MAKNIAPQDARKAQIEAEVKDKLAKEDLEKRLKEFGKEFFPLLKKYKIGLGAEPRILSLNDPERPGGWGLTAIPVWIDATEMMKGVEKNGNKDEIATA